MRLSPYFLNKQDTDPILLPNGSTVNCIFFSDDLVLISQSANGLEKALRTLFRFCNNWMMNINIKKTKIIIFQKKRRKSTTLKHQFYIIAMNKSKSPIVPPITNGSFKEHKAILKDKDKRSIFANRQHLDFLRLPIDISTKLFNSLNPAPNSDVWL